MATAPVAAGAAALAAGRPKLRIAEPGHWCGVSIIGIGAARLVRSLHAGEVLLRFVFVEGGGLALLDGDGVLRAVAQAGAQAVAVDFTHQAGLAVDHRDRTLGAARHALAAAVALRLVDPDHLACRHRQHSFFSRSPSDLNPYAPRFLCRIMP